MRLDYDYRCFDINVGVSGFRWILFYFFFNSFLASSTLSLLGFAHFPIMYVFSLHLSGVRWYVVWMQWWCEWKICRLSGIEVNWGSPALLIRSNALNVYPLLLFFFFILHLLNIIIIFFVVVIFLNYYVGFVSCCTYATYVYECNLLFLCAYVSIVDCIVKFSSISRLSSRNVTGRILSDCHWLWFF